MTARAPMLLVVMRRSGRNPGPFRWFLHRGTAGWAFGEADALEPIEERLRARYAVELVGEWDLLRASGWRILARPARQDGPVPWWTEARPESPKGDLEVEDRGVNPEGSLAGGCGRDAGETEAPEAVDDRPGVRYDRLADGHRAPHASRPQPSPAADPAGPRGTNQESGGGKGAIPASPAVLPGGELTPCACGCGTLFRRPPGRSRPQLYVNGAHRLRAFRERQRGTP